MKLQSVDDPGLNKGGGSDVLLSNDLLLDNSDGGARRLLHLGGLRHRRHQVVQLLPVLLQRVPSLHTSSTDLRQIFVISSSYPNVGQGVIPDNINIFD